MTERLLIVSNRLPVRARLERHQVALEPTVGGLATGLRAAHASSGGVWVGWPGDTARLDATQRADLDEQLLAARFAPVHLTAGDVDRYYEGFCNTVLWPLFHYMPDRIPLASRDWGPYRDVNARFADAVVAAWEPGDIVWIHDYHLLLLPSMLRERLPEARIGLFLHIPFPSSDIFRVLPWRREVLEGMLGADLIGFQTHGDQQNFLTSALRVLGIEGEMDGLEWGGRVVRVGAHPIGVDFDTFDGAVVPAKFASSVAAVRGRARTSLLLGIDRLDYTKGIPRRLLAVERLLERYPRRRGRVRLLQVAVPSREGVAAYRELRKQVDEIVGRINGDWSTFGWAPIQLVHRGFTSAEVVALYRSADAMLVTPLRDGMNLVAKEFVAARVDDGGVLVLSEFAGAAAELGEALIVNPHDLDAFADAIEAALSMAPWERVRRMRALRARVRTSDISAWSDGFVQALRHCEAPSAARELEPGETAQLVARLAEAPGLILLLDHDGTLVELTPTPEKAHPDEALSGLVAGLAALPGVAVHIVSGRDAETLTRWYGALAVHLHAEHGASSRALGGEWVQDAPPTGWWRPSVLDMMRTFAARTAGAFVEEKQVALAWHYRLADAEFGASMARELRHHLRALLASAPVEVVAGKKVIEVRPMGVNKGRMVARALAGAPPGVSVLAMGDDRTDVDLFAALPPSAVSIAVGDRVARSTWRLPDVPAVRALLAAIMRAKASSDRTNAA